RMTEARTLLGRVRDVACTAPNRVAVEDDAGKRSFAELVAHAAHVGAALEKRGLGGHKVGLFASPGASWVEAFMGCHFARCTAVALSPIYPPSELAFLLTASGASAVLVSRDLREQARIALGSTATLVIEELTESGAGSTASAGVGRASDTALVLFTSGTTGKPKAAALTQENVLAL